MRRQARLSQLVLAVSALGLSACDPGAPRGVDKATLDEAVSRAIGDPNTCVLIAEQAGGKLVYRYNNHTACGQRWPACETAERRNAGDLLDATLKDGRARRLSCNTQADASRGVGWASGPIPGKGLVYAAVMEGDRGFPGRVMADRLERAFKDAGL